MVDISATTENTPTTPGTMPGYGNDGYESKAGIGSTGSGGGSQGVAGAPAFVSSSASNSLPYEPAIKTTTTKNADGTTTWIRTYPDGSSNTATTR